MNEMDLAREARVNTLLGLDDDLSDDVIQALKDAPVWCVVGRHEVPQGSTVTAPTGTAVCRDCALTPGGRRELTPFDPTPGRRGGAGKWR